MQGVIKREDIAILAQLLDSMEEALNHLDRAVGEDNSEKVDKIKNEILSLQNEVSRKI